MQDVFNYLLPVYRTGAVPRPSCCMISAVLCLIFPYDCVGYSDHRCDHQKHDAYDGVPVHGLMQDYDCEYRCDRRLDLIARK